MKEPPISEVFALLVDLGLENGAMNIKDLPGCYEMSIGEAFIAINGHAEELKVKVPPSGAKISVLPYGATLLWNGWPVYLGDPYGGRVMCMTEDELIQKIKSLFKNERSLSV